MANYFAKFKKIPASYILGRFFTVRVVFGKFKRLSQILMGIKMPRLENIESTIVVGDSHKILESIAKDSFSECLILGEKDVLSILSFSKNCFCKDATGQRFKYEEVRDGELENGQNIAMAHCEEPLKCEAITRVVEDPKLTAIVANYLGYVPRHADVNLYWSFHGKITDEERRLRFQTIDYHFDVHDYNFCYVHIYITDTNEENGAHVLVIGSHKKKPLKWLFGSARKTDKEIEGYYGKKSILNFSRKAGIGLIEDTSCYHKALAPKSGDRLMFQIRFH